MPWNGKTSRRDRKRRRRRSMPSWLWDAIYGPAMIGITSTRRFRDLGVGHLPILDTINFTPVKYLGLGEDK